MMQNKILRLLIDSMMVVLFLALLALPFGALGLFGFKSSNANVEVLGETNIRENVDKHYKVNVRENPSVEESTSSVPLRESEIAP